MSDDESVDVDSGPSSEALSAFLLGLALGVAVLGLVWFMVAVLGGGQEEEPEPAATEASTEQALAGAPAPSAAPEPDTEERCADASAALDAALGRANPAMDQWKVHIGAMNQLVVGAITLEEASAFWEDTRLDAQQNIKRFRRDMQRLRRNGVDCPAPDLVPGGDDVRGCAQQVAAQMEALRRVRTSVNTWNQHVKHMDMLRLGTLSPEDATRMWISMWQEGADDLRDYRLAASRADQTDAC